jgi:tape measure domain-containing protein
MTNDGGKIWYGLGLDNSQLQTDALRAQSIIKGVGNQTEAEGARIDSVWKKIGVSMAGFLSVAAAKQFATSIVQVRGEIEMLEISFRTLLGSEEKASVLFSQIRKYATETPLSLTGVSKGAQTLLSFNIEGDKVMDILKQIGDISMGDEQKFQSLTLAFSQMASTGRLMGQDLLQMINAGFNPLTIIAEKTGKTISQLKDEMSEGNISVEMVADAFKTATSEGGLFYGMMEKQSKGIQGSISNLEGAFQDMLNEIGEKSQGVITGTISGLMFVVENYKELSSALAVIISMYGAYKAALIATESIQKSITTLNHTQEAQSLLTLTNAEQKEQIAKLGLSKTSKEYYDVVKSVTSENLKSAQSVLEKARNEVKASAQAASARRAEYVAAKELQTQRATELLSIKATGTARQIETAERNLAVATTKKQTAGIVFQSAARNLNAKQTAVETAAQAVSTTTTSVNTASKAANTAVTGILAAAQRGLAAAAAQANAMIAANPYGIALVAVIALAYGLYKLITYQTEVEKAQKALNDTIAEAEGKTIAENDQLDLMFLRLKYAKKGTDEYKAAKQAILNQYGEYLTGLDKEIESLNNVADAYKAIKKAVNESAEARKIQAVQDKANEIISDKAKETITEIQKQLEKKFGKKTADQYMIQLTPVIQTGEITAGAKKIIDQFNKTQIIAYQGYTPKGFNPVITTNKILEQIQGLNEVREATNHTVAEFVVGQKKVEDSTKESDKEFQSYSNTVESARENVTKFKNALNDLRSGKTKSEDYVADIDKAQKAYDEAVNKLSLLTGKKPDNNKNSRKSDTNEAVQIERETADRLQKIAEYNEKVKSQVKQGELDIAQSRIDGMKDGLDKEQAQIELTYEKMIFENQKREADMIEALKDKRELEWKNANPKADKTGKRFNRSSVSASNLDINQINQLKEYDKIANSIRLKSSQEVLTKMLSDVQTYEEARLETIRKFEMKRVSMQDYNKDGSITPKEGVTQGNISELNRQETEAINAIDEQFAQREETYKAWLNSISSISLSQLLKVLEKAKVELESLKNKNPNDPQLAVARAKVATATEAISKAKAENDQLSPKEKTFKDWKRLYDSLRRVSSEFQEVGDSAGGTAGEIIQFVGGLLTSTIQIIDGIQTLSKASSDGIEATGEASAQAISKAEKATVILAIISAAIKMMTVLVSLFKKNDYMEAFRKEVARVNAELALVKLNAEIDKSKDTVFGDNGYKKAIDNINSAEKALSRFNNTLKEIVTPKTSKSFASLFGGSSLIKNLPEIQEVEATMENVSKTIGEMELKIRHGSFWRSSKWASLKDSIPELFNEDGTVNMDALKDFIGTDTFKKLSDENQEYLQQMSNYWESYQKAVEEVKEYLSDIFGELGSQMTDALVDAFANGTDAAKSFTDSVSKMLENLAKQMIYSVTLAPIMEKAQEQMLEIMKNGNLTDSDKFYQYAQVLANLTNEAVTQQGYANDLFTQYQQMAKQLGYDIFQPEDSRTASEKGIAQASQDSIDELNGRMTAVQGHTFILSENSKILATNSNQILIQLSGIKTNTDNLSRLEAIEADISAVKSGIDDMNLKGLKIKT